MKNFIKAFCLRGLIAMGFGPIVLAIIYGIIGATDPALILSPAEVCKGVLSICVMAFIAGGIPSIYQLEQLPLPLSILIHGGVLYADYLILYLINDWIAKDITALTVFTTVFVLGFALIWLIIYETNKRSIRNLNRMLPKK